MASRRVLHPPRTRLLTVGSVGAVESGGADQAHHHARRSAGRQPPRPQQLLELCVLGTPAAQKPRDPFETCSRRSYLHEAIPLPTYIAPGSKPAEQLLNSNRDTPQKQRDQRVSSGAKSTIAMPRSHTTGHAGRAALLSAALLIFSDAAARRVAAVAHPKAPFNIRTEVAYTGDVRFG
jgi:hypothetical protein